MKEQKSLFNELQPLQEKVGIIIPGTEVRKFSHITGYSEDVQENHSFRAESDFMVEETLSYLSEMFGGATAVKQKGSWEGWDGLTVVENNTMVYAYADDLTVEKQNSIYRYAQEVAERMNQEAVAVELHGNMYFVEQG